MTMIENECSNCVKMVSCKVMKMTARRGIGGIRGHWGLLGGVEGIGAIRGHWGHQGCIGRLAGSVGTQRPEEV